MPTATDNTSAWFASATRAMNTLHDRRRRSIIGQGGNVVAGSTVPSVTGGGTGPGTGGGGGPGGITPSTAGGNVPPYVTLNQRPGAGGATAATSTASSAAAAATAAISAAPHSMAPLNGPATPTPTWLKIGSAVAVAGMLWYLFATPNHARPRPRRGYTDWKPLSAVWLLLLVGFGVFAAFAAPPPLIAEGAKPRVTIAPQGFALASYADSLAIATGKESGSIAQAGRAFAAEPGSTATAYAPAKAAGVPGSVLVFIATRPTGERVGVVLRPSTAATSAYRPWVWYTLQGGTLTTVGPVTDAEKNTITNAQKGIIP